MYVHRHTREQLLQLLLPAHLHDHRLRTATAAVTSDTIGDSSRGRRDGHEFQLLNVLPRDLIRLVVDYSERALINGVIIVSDTANYDR